MNINRDPFRPGRRLLKSAMRGLFWGSLVPFTGLLAVGTGIMVYFAGLWVLGVRGREPALLACLAGGTVLLLGVAVQWYVMTTRIRRPLILLDLELRGERPWVPEKDALLGSLRLSVEEVRAAGRQAKVEQRAEAEQHLECRRRLGERVAVDRFLSTAAEALLDVGELREFGERSARLVAEWWPAASVTILRREEAHSEVEILARAGTQKEVTITDEADVTSSSPGSPYTKLALPFPVKEAFNRGSYVGLGLPVSQDKQFPHGHNFLALGLQHRGAFSMVVYAVSEEMEAPRVSALVRVQPFLSLAYSRVMYAREMEEAQIRDTLTGAFTQSHFLGLLRAEIARANRYVHQVTCALMDLDDLRRINDRYGAHFGDTVIAETARLILEEVRSSDIVARISGGTFVLLFPESTSDMARTAMERIRARIEGHTYLVQRKDVERMTVSTGIASHPPHGVTALSLMDVARVAMETAKRAGKNRAVVAEE